MLQGKKILYLTPYFFYPPKDGGKIIISNTIKELSKNNEVDLISNISVGDKKYTPYVQKFFGRLSTVPFDAQKKHIFTLISSLVTGKSYIFNKYYRKDILLRIDEFFSTKQYDIVWLETGYMGFYAQYIKTKYPNVKICLRNHYLEHTILQLLVNKEHNFIHNWFISRELKFVEQYEYASFQFVDQIYVLTEQDKSEIIQKNNALESKISVLYPSVDFEKYGKTPLNGEKNLVFIGSLDYGPNISAILWFIDNIFGEIEKAFPDVKLYILGKSMPRKLLRKRKNNIILDGGLKEDTFYYGLARMVICPLFAGKGIKIKVLNAFASGNAVISTSVGVEGLKVQDGEDFILADSKEQWIELIKKYLENTEFLEKIGNHSFEYAKENFDSSKICDIIFKE